MNGKIIKTAFFLVCLLIPWSAGHASQSWNPEGFWVGHIEYRQAQLKIRIEINKDKDSFSAFLDIPSLVYAGQPVAVSIENDQVVTVDFPFGLSQVTLGPVAENSIVGTSGAISVALERTPAPAYRKTEIEFGAFEPKIEGTVYIPNGEGPFPAVILVAGSGNANRSQWSYSSWADFYVRLGYAALVYDRRPDLSYRADGQLVDFYDHADDIVAAIGLLKTKPEIDQTKIGLAGHSRGGWISLAVTERFQNLAFLVLLSPAAETPAEQEVTSILTGMEQDGLGALDISAARSYLRLYFYVAATGKGWDLLAMEMEKAKDANWFQYVDQPNSIEDLDWWRVHMNFPARSYLKKLNLPILALWGGHDFITPWADYQAQFVVDNEKAGNAALTTHVFPEADHRLEIDPGTDEHGDWHWFGMAPGVLETIQDWLLDQQ